jgi:dienelactone hydrolase
MGWFDQIAIFFIERHYRNKGEKRLDVLEQHLQSKESWERRAEKLRKGILHYAELDPLPTRTPLNANIHSQRDYPTKDGGYSVSNFYFESVPGFFVTGNLYQPLTGEFSLEKKYPVILLPHGHFKLGRMEPMFQHLGASFARMGVIAATYDMVGYNDSNQLVHNVPHALTLQLWNSIRMLDFLLNLPGIDNTRVGITGASGGGTQSFLLTAVDPRITAVAPAVMVSSSFYGGCVCESGLPIHKNPDYSTNNAEIAALAAPRPQHLISIGTDWSRFTPIRELPYLKKVYALYGAESLVGNTHFPKEKHDYGSSKRQAVYQFFQKIFHLETHAIVDVNDLIDESENQIEDVSLLKSFTDRHPRPPNALIGEQQILTEFRRLQNS